MIALNHGIPTVIMPDGRSVLFDKKWIVIALQQAAQAHGYDRWPASFALAEALTLYLQKELPENTVTISYLEKIICNLLVSLRYHEIAASFFLPDPPATLSLLDLAEEAGNCYELRFFQLLQQQLQKITTSKSSSLKIADLEPCLQSLSCRTRSRRHRPLREEIVSYVRAYGNSSFFKKNRSEYPLEIKLS